MKKLFLICGIVISTLVMSSCNKHEPIQTQVETSQEAHWRTPNGYLIPYSEKDNWKDYLKQNLEQDKFAPIKYYGSKSCVLENSRCSLECVQVSDPDDCIKESACAPCINCC